jgi:hypothetical protein
VIFGVGLPAFTLGLEWTTAMCAGEFFDPIPTFWHALLVALVPALNLLVWLGVHRGQTVHRARLGWASGAALGVSLFYTLLFLPLTIPGILAIWVFGLGLLPLSPVLALLCGIILRGHLRRLGGDPTPKPLPGLWGGLALGFLGLAAAELPVWITRLGLQMAASAEPATQQRGLRWLRRWGHEEIMRRECYGRTRTAENMDLVGWLLVGERIWPEHARAVYYRVTGRAFNSLPAPNVRTGRSRWMALDEWTWDNDQGGEAVGGRLKGLRLHHSRLDAAVDLGGLLSYTEWTLEFKNDSSVQREARMQLLLPPGGVVARLTLWVNGEEREAAFAGRSQVRAAYEKIAIQRRRDPVLVTTCGPDRVLVQCFPVPPQGGLMRIRLGITAPTALEDDQAVYVWPCFLERNFTITEQCRHSVWVEAKGPSPAPPYTRSAQSKDTELADPANVVRVPRAPKLRMTWTQDVRGADKGWIVQTIREAEVQSPKCLVIVVDGSKGMREHAPAIAGFLRKLPAGMELHVLVAGDEVQRLTQAQPGSGSAALSEAAEKLDRFPFVGGQDNVPALIQAWDLAATKTAGAILWLHEPQAMELESIEGLRQRYQRVLRGPPLYELQTRTGADRLIEKLDEFPSVQALHLLGSLEQQLQRLAATWSGQNKPLSLARERSSAQPSVTEDTRETSFHLARLWARDEIMRLRSARKLTEALELAARYQLVTPLSGAVVLETAEQFRETGLEPADPATVPAIPEPGTWALLLGGLLVLALAARRRNRRSRAC